MTTSMITTAITVMTDVVVAPSLGGLLVGCVLLLTGTVPVVVFAPTIWRELVSSGLDAVVRKKVVYNVGSVNVIFFFYHDTTTS